MMRALAMLIGLLVLAGCVPNDLVLIATEGTEIGDFAPDFSLLDTNSQPVTLSQFRNSQHVVLVFHTGSL